MDILGLFQSKFRPGYWVEITLIGLICDFQKNQAKERVEPPSSFKFLNSMQYN